MESSPRRRAFPLVPRQRLTGVAYGAQRSTRRGQGSEVAGSRPYVPGDRLSWIDWHASARLSVAKNEDHFVVRQYYAEVAPRVVVVVDRRPSMGLYPDDLPWLAKPRVLHEAITSIIAAAQAARAYVGYLDFADGAKSVGGGAHWIAPHRQGARRIADRLGAEFGASSNSLDLAIEYLLELRRDVPAGTFVFVLSDFLQSSPAHLWSRARGRGWDLVPVIVQDPVWEQSFPPVESLLIPVADPATGTTTATRLSQREVIERRAANENRLSDLLLTFRGLQFDPVVLDTTQPAAIDEAFIRWSVRRRMTRGHAA
jgi:uncharacterized protein (DUF58 family)